MDPHHPTMPLCKMTCPKAIFFWNIPGAQHKCISCTGKFNGIFRVIPNSFKKDRQLLVNFLKIPLRLHTAHPLRESSSPSYLFCLAKLWAKLLKFTEATEEKSQQVLYVISDFPATPPGTSSDDSLTENRPPLCRFSSLPADRPGHLSATKIQFASFQSTTTF